MIAREPSIVSARWTRQIHRGDKWSRELCIVCRSPLADGKSVMVHHDGLECLLCWLGRAARAEPRSVATRSSLWLRLVRWVRER